MFTMASGPRSRVGPQVRGLGFGVIHGPTDASGQRAPQTASSRRDSPHQEVCTGASNGTWRVSCAIHLLRIHMASVLLWFGGAQATDSSHPLKAQLEGRGFGPDCRQKDMMRAACANGSRLQRVAVWSLHRSSLPQQMGLAYLPRCLSRAAGDGCHRNNRMTVGNVSASQGGTRNTPRPELKRAASTSTGAETSTGEKAHRRTLVVPVDNSEDSEFAVSWAMDHIYRPGDAVHLLHCIASQHPGRSTFSDGKGGPLIHVDAKDEHDEIVRKRHWATVEAVKRRFEQNFLDRCIPAEDLIYDVVQESQPPVAVTGLFGVSDIVQETEEAAPPGSPEAVEQFETPQMVGDIIISKAEEVDAAAVVMAAHDKSPLMEFFLGSISNFCIHHCSKPVVLLHNVRGSQEDRMPGASTGRQLAVAIDDSQQSADALSWTISTMYRPGDTIHLIHVIPHLTGQTQVFVDGLGITMQDPGFDPMLDEETPADAAVSDHFCTMLEEAKIPYQVDLIQELETDSVATLGKGIVSKAKELNADSLVMASHSKGFLQEFVLGSVTSYVTHHAKDLPVVVLHP